jgi:CRISPR-associated protein Cmr1
MHMPYTLSATYEIVTPMFIGDARQEAQTVQPASVKGALRFWWRALNWGRVFIENNGKNVEALQQLHREEGKLFGRAAEEVNKKQIGGQGNFLLRVIKTKSLQKKSEYDLNQDNTYKLGKGSWQSYLLGLGLMEWEKGIGENLYIRGALTSGTFTVELFCRNKKIVEDIKPALLAWGLLGGLGSRNRKGLGSVAIRELDGQPIAQDYKSYCDELKKLMKLVDLIDDCPPFTAFGNKAQVKVSKQATQKPWEQLGTIAETMQMFRSWGRNGKVNDKSRHKNSYLEKEKDHGRIYEIAKNDPPPDDLPHSITFGLPRQYNLSQAGKVEIIPGKLTKKNSSNPQPDKQLKRARRASPLFIHIHSFGKNQTETVAVYTFLPATFLPPADKILLQKAGQWFEKSTSLIADWSVIEEYLAKTAPKPKWEQIQ